MVRQSPVAPMSRPRRTVSTPADAVRPVTEPDLPEEPAAPPARELAPVGHAELGPIIRSKIQPPVLRESTLSRQRLLDRLTVAVQGRLTLVIAEAGYGKTTLLTDFAERSDMRTPWYRLDPTDADIVTWANHIIAGMREFEPTFGQATLDLMAHLPAGGPPRSAFVSSVISEMGSMEPAISVLVLDDFHAVDESDEATEFVQRLLQDSPPWLRIVIDRKSVV